MTTAQELAQNIIADATARAEKMREETRQEVARISSQTSELVAAKQAQLQQQAQEAHEVLLHKAQAQQQLALRQEILRCKQELIDDACAAARQRLENSAERKQLLERLWRAASSQLAIGSVTTTKRDAPFFKAKRVRINLEDGDGGFVAHAKDGTTRIDLRFATLLEQVRSQKTAEIAAVLFADKRAPAQCSKGKAPDQPKSRSAKRASPRARPAQRRRR